MGVETVVCTTCCERKPASDFYAHCKKCKPCYCAAVRANREAKREQYLEFDRNRAMLPHRVQARRAYRLTDAGKEARRRELVRERSIRSEAYKARNALNNALRDGLVKRAPCEVCGATRVHGHHHDYSQPLVVRWLCPKHHTEIHSGAL